MGKFLLSILNYWILGFIIIAISSSVRFILSNGLQTTKYPTLTLLLGAIVIGVIFQTGAEIVYNKLHEKE